MKRLWLLLLLIAPHAWTEDVAVAPNAAPSLFPRPKEILPNIAFWTRVYSEWGVDQVALSDQEDLTMIYRVLDVPSNDTILSSLKRERFIEHAKKEVSDALAQLESLKPKSEEGLSGLTKDVYVALKNVTRPDKYTRASWMRAQVGLKDRFKQGYATSGTYDEDIRHRLVRAGLPEELIAVAFVESLFYNRSHSRAGAGGIWQFLKRTAKESMFVNNLVDERFDPILSTEGAIKYLRSAQEQLGSWPLAITSYNYGRAGMRRAMTIAGSSDLGVIVANYQQPRFGFAAKNYYAEFCAALDVYKQAPKLFPDVAKRAHWDYNIVYLSRAAYLPDLFQVGAVSRDWVFELNPGLTKRAQEGKEVLPSGFSLRIPLGGQARFEAGFKKLSSKQLARAENHVRVRHRVNGKQSLHEIAGTYDVYHERLAERHGSHKSKKPRRGSYVTVYSADSRFSVLPPAIYSPSAQKEKKPEALPSEIASSAPAPSIPSAENHVTD